MIQYSIERKAKAGDEPVHLEVSLPWGDSMEVKRQTVEWGRVLTPVVCMQINVMVLPSVY